MRREARAQLRCELRRKRYAARHGAARRQRWVRGGPGAGRDGSPRILEGCGAGSPAVTAAGACRGRECGGPTVGPWSEVGRGGWPPHGGLGPGPSACHCPSPPRTSASRDTHPCQPPSACWLARARRQSEGIVSVSPLPGAVFRLWGRKSSSGLEIATASLITVLPSKTCNYLSCPLLASGGHARPPVPLRLSPVGWVPLGMATGLSDGSISTGSLGAVLSEP